MLNSWIDTSKPPKNGYIGENQVGFQINEKGILALQRAGFVSDFTIFDIVETPQGVKDFINKYYTMKKEARTPQEKIRAKQMLNFAVGYLQRKNPYLRAFIICSCNEFIENLLDENSLFWNTDSITSRVRRPDIEEFLGDDIGEWKIEHQGLVAYKGNTYQWDKEKPTYRGIPKDWFNKDFDLLVDKIPVKHNTFYYDKKEHKIKEEEQ